MVLFIIETEYILFILAVKKITWLRFLLIELGLLLSSNQYIEIKVIKESTGVKEIKTNIKDQKKEDYEDIVLNINSNSSTFALIDSSFLLKSNNSRSILLTYNPTYYTKIKYIDIKHHYICEKVDIRQINFQYIITFKMIVDGLTKSLSHIKFHNFIKQINIK